MSSYLSRYTHANYLTGIASAGYASYLNGFTSYDTELFYLLDNLGYVWTLYVYGQPDGSYSAYLGYFPSTLPQLKFPGYLGQSVLLHGGRRRRLSVSVLLHRLYQ